MQHEREAKEKQDRKQAEVAARQREMDKRDAERRAMLEEKQRLQAEQNEFKR